MFGWFKPQQAHTAVIEGPAGTQTLRLQPGETVLNGALRLGVAFPFSCKVGGCGTCKCQLLSGQVRELTDKSYLLSKEEIQQHYILGCQSVPRSDVTIRLPVDPLSQQQARGTVMRHEALTHDITEVFIALDQPLRYRPGQHALLQPERLDLPARCYSFAHAYAAAGAAYPDAGTLEVSFFVRRVPNGRLSHWLTSPQALNQPVTLQAARGPFYLREGTGPLLAVAGGSGLAPLIALLEGALQGPARERDMHLLMGARQQRDLYYLDAIEQLRAAWRGRFVFTPVLSDEPAESGWTGHRGLVTEQLAQRLEELGDALVAGGAAYLCGPPPMVDTASAHLTARGLPAERILCDRFADQSIT